MDPDSNDDPNLARTRLRQLTHWYEKTFSSPDTQAIAQRRTLRAKLAEQLQHVRQHYADGHVNSPDIGRAEKLLTENPQRRRSSSETLDIDMIKPVLTMRTSCREWSRKKVPSRVIDELLEAGIHAPSSANRQAVRFVIVEDKTEREYLALQSRHAFTRRAPLHLLIGVDTRAYANNEYDRIVEDAAVCAQNITTLAEAYGLGSCYITPRELDSDDVKERYRIPRHVKVFIMLAIGYKSFVPVKPPRMALEEYILSHY